MGVAGNGPGTNGELFFKFGTVVEDPVSSPPPWLVPALLGCALVSLLWCSFRALVALSSSGALDEEEEDDITVTTGKNHMAKAGSIAGGKNEVDPACRPRLFTMKAAKSLCREASLRVARLGHSLGAHHSSSGSSSSDDLPPLGGGADGGGGGLHPRDVHLPVSHYRDTGVRKYMEDRSAFMGKLQGRVDASYVAVFDGHGGALASQHCALHLHRHLSQDPALLQDPAKALARAFVKTEEQFLSNSESRLALDGTTALAAVVMGTRLVVANAGDSRALLVQRGGAFVALSVDHKPCLPEEQRRITDLGGRVIHFGRWRVEGVLAVSRAIGDRHLKPYVTCEPDVVTRELGPDDHFLVLATDGLWDVLSNEAVAGMVARTAAKQSRQQRASSSSSSSSSRSSSSSFQSLSRRLSEEAYLRGSTDNISVLVVDLRPALAPSASPTPASSIATTGTSSSSLSGSIDQPPSHPPSQTPTWSSVARGEEEEQPHERVLEGVLEEEEEEQEGATGKGQQQEEEEENGGGGELRKRRRPSQQGGRQQQGSSSEGKGGAAAGSSSSNHHQ